MHILVTGATGFVGRALCATLDREGHIVITAGRSSNTQAHNVKHFKVSGINADTDWSYALEKVNVIIHLAGRVHVIHDTAVDPLIEYRRVNVAGTLQLARKAAQLGVQRFIFISSIKVNGESTLPDQAFTTEDPPHPQDAYGISKLEAEQGLLLIAQETGMEVVIIRPPLVYGPRVKANFESMMRSVKSGIPLPLGAIHNRRSFVYVGNLISLIVCCIRHPKAANQVFLVSDGDDLSTTSLLGACAAALGVRARLFPVPQAWITFFAGLIGKSQVAKRLCGNLQVDITKARSLLDWSPPISVAEGLQATAQDFLKK